MGIAEVIVAVYESMEEADAAITDLRAAGIPPDIIEQSATTQDRDGRFWSWLASDHENRAFYESEISSGRRVVSVHAIDPEQATEAMRRLCAHHPEEIQQQHDPNPGAPNTAMPPAGMGPGAPLPQISDAEQPRVRQRITPPPPHSALSESASPPIPIGLAATTRAALMRNNNIKRYVIDQAS